MNGINAFILLIFKLSAVRFHEDDLRKVNGQSANSYMQMIKWASERDYLFAIFASHSILWVVFLHFAINIRQNNSTVSFTIYVFDMRFAQKICFFFDV